MDTQSGKTVTFTQPMSTEQQIVEYLTNLFGNVEFIREPDLKSSGYYTKFLINGPFNILFPMHYFDVFGLEIDNDGSLIICLCIAPDVSDFFLS